MLGRRRRFVVCVSVLLAGLAACGTGANPANRASESVEGDRALGKRVDAAARRGLEASGAAGLSVAVMRSGSLRFSRGYGFADLNKKVPSGPETIYRTGSVGKQFTAAGLLRLAEQNKVSLEDTVGKHLPRFPRRLHKITIRQLLAHTAGLLEVNAIPRFAKTQGVGMTFDEVLRLIAAQPLQFEPGTGYSYSNSGYLVAGAIIREVTGHSPARYLIEDNLRPLGMKDTSDCLQPRTPQWASGYDSQERGGWSRVARLGRPPTLMSAGPINMAIVSAAGGFCSTALDLALWTQQLHESQFLSRESLEDLTRATKLPEGGRAAYGLGTQLRDFGNRRAFGHAGIIQGFNAVVAYFPHDRTAVALMINARLPEQDGKKVWSEILGAVFDEPPHEWEEPYSASSTEEG